MAWPGFAQQTLTLRFAMATRPFSSPNGLANSPDIGVPPYWSLSLPPMPKPVDSRRRSRRLRKPVSSPWPQDQKTWRREAGKCWNYTRPTSPTTSRHRFHPVSIEPLAAEVVTGQLPPVRAAAVQPGASCRCHRARSHHFMERSEVVRQAYGSEVVRHAYPVE